jgi:hypothetical protein
MSSRKTCPIKTNQLYVQCRVIATLEKKPDIHTVASSLLNKKKKKNYPRLSFSRVVAVTGQLHVFIVFVHGIDLFTAAEAERKKGGAGERGRGTKRGGER